METPSTKSEVDSPQSSAKADESTLLEDGAIDAELSTESSFSTYVFAGMLVLVVGGAIFLAMGGTRMVRRLVNKHVGPGKYRRVGDEDLEK